MGFKNTVCHSKIWCFGILFDCYFSSSININLKIVKHKSGYLLNMKVLGVYLFFHLPFLLSLMTHSCDFTFEKLLK